MISCLINKVPSVRIGPWNNDKKVTKKQLLKKLPEDIDITERCAHGFNRFISPGDRAYCRLQFYFGDKTTLGEIKSVTQGLTKPTSTIFLDCSLRCAESCDHGNTNRLGKRYDYLSRLLQRF